MLVTGNFVTDRTKLDMGGAVSLSVSLTFLSLSLEFGGTLILNPD